MKPYDFATPLRNTQAYLRDLEAWVTEFLPWTVQSGAEPELILPPEVEAAYLHAELIARRMLGGVSQVNARNWREAARQSLHGKRIYEALRTEMGSPLGMRVDELAARNARLITGLSERLELRAARFIGAEQRKGLRSDLIASKLRNLLPQARASELRALARTEVARAETAFTQARSERLGLAWYEWATSEDQRVRPSHKLMDKVLVRWADPAAPEQLAGEKTRGHYHPGGVRNCRCGALPLVSLDEVRWPHKVYEHGQIEWMTRRDFERWARAAA